MEKNKIKDNNFTKSKSRITKDIFDTGFDRYLRRKLDNTAINSSSVNSEQFKIVNNITESVLSVNNKTGEVTLNTSEIPESTNLYFTEERVQDTLGSTLIDTNSIEFIYDDVLGEVTANLRIQNTATINLSIDSNGLKADALGASDSIMHTFLLMGA